MADGVSIEGGKSAAEIALALLFEVSEAEDKRFAAGGWKGGADRKYILDTYAECLKAARGARPTPSTLGR